MDAVVPTDENRVAVQTDILPVEYELLSSKQVQDLSISHRYG